jgi:hypothetical protein
MLTRLLVAGSFIAAGMLAASAQTTVPPGAPPAPSAVPVISDATHCRDANGMVRLKVGATGAPSTTGSASNTVPSGSPGTSSSVNNPSGMPGSTQAQARRPFSFLIARAF